MNLMARIPVVDDEAKVASSLERLLRRDGYRILSACSDAINHRRDDATNGPPRRAH